MCTATPVTQTDPSNPANYPLAQNYGMVTSNWVTSDGVVHGSGDTLGNRYAYFKTHGTDEPDPNAGVTKASPSGLRM